ncbi:TIM barrel protein [Adhaeretor mobilis]|nr:TIM barrel protein [Adhaeretor mobilis]
MAATKGRIKQSIAYWCFNTAGDQWDVEKTCEVANQLGCPSVELVEPSDWPILKKHGLVSALSLIGMEGAPFVKGYNNPIYHEELTARTTQAIDEHAAAGFPNVIAFTGFEYRDAEDPTSEKLSREEGADNCVQGLKELADYAAKQGVTICLEHLNTRDDSHPMKGHPGYQGDDLDYVASIIRRVDSPGLKLLFDVYHVQIMHGDILRRLEENKDILGHIHAAGCPGRAEIDATQEVNYPAVMHKLLELGYDGYVGQEYLPTRDPFEGLKEAVQLCDV